MEAHRVLDPPRLLPRRAGPNPVGARQAERLGELAAAITDESALEPLLRSAAEAAASMLGVRRCAIYLRSADGFRFEGQVAYDRRADAANDDRIVHAVLDAEDPEVVAILAVDGAITASPELRWVGGAASVAPGRSPIVAPLRAGHETVGLMIVDDAAASVDYGPDAHQSVTAVARLTALAVAQHQRREALSDRLRSATRKLRAAQRTAALDEELMRRSAAGLGIPEVVASLATLTGRSVAVLARPFTSLAFDEMGKPAEALPRLLAPEVREQAEVAERLKGIGISRPEVLGPYPRLGVHERYLVARIRLLRHGGGLVVLSERDRPLQASDAGVLRRAAALLAIELAAQRRVVEANVRAHESVVRDTVHGLDDPHVLQRRARAYGLELEAPHVVCLVAARSGSDGVRPSAAEVRRAAVDAELPWPHHVTAMRDGVAVVLAIDPELPRHVAVAGTKAEVERLIGRLDGAGRGIVAAVSSSCREPAGYRRALDESRQVLGCLTRLAAPQTTLRVLCADDLGAGRLLLGQTSIAAAERFSEETFGALVSDHGEGAKLLSTLEAFFDTNHNTRATAARLGIHENTVRYRFRKITQATGLDVMGSADDQLTARLALLVLRLRSTTTPSGSTHEDQPRP